MKKKIQLKIIKKSSNSANGTFHNSTVIYQFGLGVLGNLKDPKLQKRW
jgi:hypothetical protein